MWERSEIYPFCSVWIRTLSLSERYETCWVMRTAFLSFVKLRYSKPLEVLERYTHILTVAVAHILQTLL
jgi:hypothetical protein